MLKVDRCAGPIILTHCRKGIRVPDGVDVGRLDLGRRLQQSRHPLDPHVGVGTHHQLGQGRRLDEKEPVPQIGGDLAGYVGIDVRCGYDIEERQLEDFFGMVLGEPA